MDPELEDLVKALDAFLQATKPEARDLEAVYNAKLEKVLERKPNLSKQSLTRAVIFQYNRWRKTQRRYPTIPPKA